MNRRNVEPILAARNIVNRFGSQEIHDNISLEVFPHEVFGIVGGSGAGKTVLLKTLLGLHDPNAGEVTMSGRNIKALSPEEKATLIGVLFQQGALFSSLSVAQNVMLPLREYTDLPQEEQERVHHGSRLAGLSADTALKCPSQLSGGMVRRAALARALALDPQVLFLDEPTSDLDPITASGIDALIQQLNASMGLTVVIVTHDLSTLFTVCHRVAVLADRKITVGTLDDLLQSDHPWIHEFFHGPRAKCAASANEIRSAGDQSDKHYFVVGLFIIGFSVAAALFSIWLVGAGNRDDVIYRIRFAESVSGMAVGDAVQYRGVEVGTVKAMRIDSADPRLVLVDVRLRKETPVKTDTKASLRLKGITGTVAIELSGGDPAAPTLLSVTSKDQVPEIPSERNRLLTIFDQVPQTIKAFQEIEEQLKKLVSNKNIAALSSTLEELRSAAHNASELFVSLKENPSQLLFGRKKEADSGREPEPKRSNAR
jgi:phospholipid/cholesterol/gamma-HCH transport system ATP-binding protein